MNKRGDKVNARNGQRWMQHAKAHWQVYAMSSMAAATLLVVAYRIARADGVTWTLPYTGTTSTTDSNEAAIFAVNTGAGFALHGQSSHNIGVVGDGAVIGVQANLYGNGGAAAVYGNGNNSTGVIGTSSSDYAYGLYGVNSSNSIYAVGASGITGGGSGLVGYGFYGIRAISNSAPNSLAGLFSGDVLVNGTLTASSKNFKIDHPLDPANQYLVHACVESSENMNIYRGNVRLDSDGKAMIEMPKWFQALNRDCSYELTCIGGYSPVHVSKELENNQFEIAGGKPGLKVSWVITGVRQDAYAKAHPLQVEQEKAGKERGKYLDPADFGKPKNMGVDYEMTHAVEVSSQALQRLKFVSSPTPTPPKMPKATNLKAPTTTRNP